MTKCLLIMSGIQIVAQLHSPIRIFHSGKCIRTCIVQHMTELEKANALSSVYLASNQSMLEQNIDQLLQLVKACAISQRLGESASS